MDIIEFLGVHRVDESTWRFDVDQRLTTPGKFLFGGCGLASGIVALEAASGRPTVYAAAHYLSFAPLGSEVDLTVDLAVVGRRVTQARATATSAGREVLTVNAALGTERTRPSRRPWLAMPVVPRARGVPTCASCRTSLDESIFDHVETRIAIGRPVRRVGRHARLAGFRALGSDARVISTRRRRRSPSLATSWRVGRANPWDGARWAEALTTPFGLRPSYRPNGFSSRSTCTPSPGVLARNGDLWSRDGTLLGTASQSMSSKIIGPPRK